MDRGTVLRVMGIDPGGVSLGCSFFDHEIEQDISTLWFSETYKTVPIESGFNSLDTFSRRGKRLRMCGDYVLSLAERYRPNIIVCEDAYMGRFPTAYRSLCEGIICIQNSVYQYNPYMRLWLVDPPSGKIAVGAPGRGGGKDAVRDAILRNRNFVSEIEVDQLDEHSIDSIAIAYWGVAQWREENQPI